MINTPSIFKTPESAGKAIGSYQAGCSYYRGTYGYKCGNYNGKCVDTSYSSKDIEGGAGAAIGTIGTIVTIIGFIVS